MGLKNLPTKTVHLTPMCLPKASNCSPIWKANSLVGVNTRPKSRCGLSSKACSMGKAKAPVLPDPVSARPMTSLFSKATGMASAWILLGPFHPKLAQASHKGSTKPRDSNVLLPSSLLSSSTSFLAKSWTVFSTSESDESDMTAFLQKAPETSNPDSKRQEHVKTMPFCFWWNGFEPRTLARQTSERLNANLSQPLSSRLCEERQ